MQISLISKIVLFLALYCISDLSIKNNIFRKIMNRANSAKNFQISNPFRDQYQSLKLLSY